MKILFDHDVFTYQKTGGIARVLSELIGQMEKQEPGCCRMGFKFTNTSYLYGLGLAERFGLYHYPFGNHLWAKQLFFRINRFLFHQAVRRNDFDLLHLTFYPAPEIREMTAKPIAVTVHDMTPEIYPELFPGAGKWIAAKKFWCHHADLIFTDKDLDFAGPIFEGQEDEFALFALENDTPRDAHLRAVVRDFRAFGRAFPFRREFNRFARDNFGLAFADVRNIRTVVESAAPGVDSHFLNFP